MLDYQLKHIRELRAFHVDEAYTTMNQTVVDMSRVTKKSGSQICILTDKRWCHYYQIQGAYIYKRRQFATARHDVAVNEEISSTKNVPPNVMGITAVLYKFSANKKGRLFKPQSIHHVTPICEFTANDSRESMRAVIFYEGSSCRANTEDALHR